MPCLVVLAHGPWKAQSLDMGGWQLARSVEVPLPGAPTAEVTLAAGGTAGVVALAGGSEDGSVTDGDGGTVASGTRPARAAPDVDEIIYP